MSDFLMSDFFLLVRFHILHNRFDDCRPGICEGWEYSVKPQAKHRCWSYQIKCFFARGEIKYNAQPILTIRAA
jgi:hypothetical protein